MDPKNAAQWPLQRGTLLILHLKWAFLQTPTRAAMGLVVGGHVDRATVSFDYIIVLLKERISPPVWVIFRENLCPPKQRSATFDSDTRKRGQHLHEGLGLAAADMAKIERF